MRGLPSSVLALGFVFFVLISLLVTPIDSDSRITAVSTDSPRISDVGLRLALRP